MIGSEARFRRAADGWRSTSASVCTCPRVYLSHSMRHSRLTLLFALTLVGAALSPLLLARLDARRMAARLDQLAASPGGAAVVDRLALETRRTADPALFVRVQELEPLLASWQTIGGCGAGAGSGTGAGIKWIGRNVSGGLFNVQEQFSYTKLGTVQYPERDYVANTLINADLSEKWNAGINIPLIYKYLTDPRHKGPDAPIDYSNGGLGDISLQVTRRLGSINATSLTGMVGFPTGTHDASYAAPDAAVRLPINQTAQLGFGKYTGTLILDHTMDQVWGLVVVGGLASWRGGKNEFSSYRAPTASVYSYAGYFWGPVVPAFGLTLSGFKGHDVDQQSEQPTPLVALSANLSLEWSTPWIAILLAGSIPYKWDGVLKDESGNPRSPWGFLPWTLALGVSMAPF
jgi:hypothetical protein